MSDKGLKIVVLAAPSGAGKSTIARRLLDHFPDLRFSVSATTREPRDYEVEGKHYFFLTTAAFNDLIANGGFIEFEEVYTGCYYGTLRSEVERIAQEGAALLDIDVAGAKRVKALYGDSCLVVFIQPPSIEVLAERLKSRGTETDQTLSNRLTKATEELSFAVHADVIITNDVLDRAVQETIQKVEAFLLA